MHALRPAFVSEEEFLRLPESTSKVELVDGELVVPPAPTFGHQRVLTNVVFALKLWARDREPLVTVGQSPVDIRFAPGRILQPDAFVILDEVPSDTKGPLARIPELCIEVLSSDRIYDRLTKRVIYGEAGVAEYWVVEQSGVVERWFGPGLRQSEDVGGVLETPLLPGFALDVRTLPRT